MASTLVFLVRHAKAADRYDWTGGDRDRPLIDKGRRQADRLAGALHREQPVLVAASPWLRCRQTAAPLAAAMRLQPQLRGRQVALVLSGGNISPAEITLCLQRTAPVRSPLEA